MLTFLLVVHAIITAILVGVILMQRSEGGGLGMGGSPTGLMSARGAADFLTRATTVLATLFVTLSIASAVVASRSSGPGTIDTSLKRTTAPAPPAPAPAVPLNGDPLGAAGSGPAPVVPLPPPTMIVPAPTVPSAAPVAAAPQKSKTPVTSTPVMTRSPDRPPGRVEPVSPKPDRPVVAPTVTPAPAPAAGLVTPPGSGN